MGITCQCLLPCSFPPLFINTPDARLHRDDLLVGYGATSHLESGGFIRSRPHVTHPDIQFHFLPLQVIDHGRVASKLEAYQVRLLTAGLISEPRR